MASLHKTAAKFQELNEFGTTLAPACQNSSGCGDCTFHRKRLSREDQAVVTHSSFVAKMRKAIGEGKVRLLSEDEIDTWH